MVIPSILTSFKFVILNCSALTHSPYLNLPNILYALLICSFPGCVPLVSLMTFWDVNQNHLLAWRGRALLAFLWLIADRPSHGLAQYRQMWVLRMSDGNVWNAKKTEFQNPSSCLPVLTFFAHSHSREIPWGFGFGIYLF